MINSSVSIVIPAKNEELSLSLLLPKIKCLDVSEIIVVDDGSTDETHKVCLKQGVKVIRHPYSKGNGAAIKSGAKVAKGDVIVFMDADGQHDPGSVKKLLMKYQEGYDMVVGARSKAGQSSVGRMLANRLYNMLASYITGRSVKDLTSGLRAVSANKFREFLFLLPNGFSYPTTITMAFFRVGYSVGYEDVDVTKRSEGSHIKPLRDGVRFLLIIFKVGTLYSPLKIFFPTSLVIFLIGVFYYAYTYVLDGRFTNMSALMFTTALIVFMVGLVSEQVNAVLYSKINSSDDFKK